ncbi:MAG: zf-HC2 domain-containing protein [Woeseiaceae bacterium]
MAGNSKDINEHVGEWLSGYIDGELTQQQRQRVEVHCDACTDCATLRNELMTLRAEVGDARLSAIGEDKWREMMADTTVKTTRGIGWLLIAGGFLGIAGIASIAFLTDASISLTEKIIVGAIYGGFAALFISVLRQRLIERKSDKYKDVEI